MLEIIILVADNHPDHELYMNATRRSIATMCPVSSIVVSETFPERMEKCFVVRPGDIFIRCPYKVLDIGGTFSYINLDIESVESGTYYSREVTNEFKFKQSPIFYNKYMDDRVGVYIKEPIVTSLYVDHSVLDTAQKEHKQININKHFYNHTDTSVSFEFIK